MDHEMSVHVLAQPYEIARLLHASLNHCVADAVIICRDIPCQDMRCRNAMP